MKNWRTHCL